MPEGVAPTGINARLVLIDPADMSVLWANAPATETLTAAGDLAGVTIEQVTAMTGSSEVPEALRRTAETGEPQHVKASLVGTVRGDLLIATSVYSLPGGMLLLVSENAWQPRHGDGTLDAPKRRPRRGR